MNEILDICKRAKAACGELLRLGSKAKFEILNAVADELLAQKDAIKATNAKDLTNGEKSGLNAALLDRLRLTDARIEAMAQGVREVAGFAEVVGENLGGWSHPNGMQINRVRVPLGVLGIIYESRPNVSIDAAALALKSGNAAILRGSASALNSNIFLVNLFNEAGAKFGLPKGAVQLVESADREVVAQMAKMSEYIDVLIPRGGKSLKDFIAQNATVPIIMTGEGVCHIFVDESANLSEAAKIIKNAKIQRPSVCNAVECVLLHERVAGKILPELVREMPEVEFRVSDQLLGSCADLRGAKNVKLAGESDFGAEFLDLVLAVRAVRDTGEAISFINAHSSGHSDAILSENYANIERFLNEVGSAIVYANASTRFSDGSEFGFGGEIGISTQKLHARGPMGVRELTTYKYVVRGGGQIR
ncbi:glutamate-5-semialdehyde dehydrogenase [uncultured Campylobacter sp.]|uniref:glutamate-5-semialdehyde dehydrogenase n=1 Tax=uncultured Campylobacter sp. TaxID=218934 RepID=UPI0026147A29|nr:glutamate-5-semialdehyde dehydrogenase [uncultured Campylobacter sp.]